MRCQSALLVTSVSSNYDPTGRVGHVTGRIEPHGLGEVTLPFNGGTQAFHARAIDHEEIIETGERVVVVDFDPPQTVYVSRFSGVT
jgi:hypothetical protein